MKKIGCFFALIVVGFLGFGIYRSLNPPRIGGTPFAKLSTAAKKERRESAQTLVKQVEEVARSARRGESKTFKVAATEEQLNTLLQDRLRVEKFFVRDLRVGLTPGLLQVQGDADVKGFSIPVTMDATLQAEGGELKCTVKSLSGPGVSLPDEYKEKAQKYIEKGLGEALHHSRNTKIEKVTIEEGKLVLEGRTG